ncbi:MAG TPA: hypothetical protein VHD56_18925 [Tepidisphaeraceae bacterium]|nr:hypothetical protein [Tepidisphaeraceae bacterium]
MRYTGVLLLVVLVTGCVQSTTKVTKSMEKAPENLGGWIPTGNDDLDITAVALTDFLHIPNVTNLTDKSRTSLAVNKMTNGPSDLIAPAQLATELRRMVIPIGSIDSLQTRNQTPSEVSWIPPGLAFFSSDLDALPHELEELQTAFPAIYPKAIAGVWIWLPGYSEDGQYAIFRFSFAPTPHGAIATYIMAKDDTGKWHMIDRKINYLG